MGHKMLQAGNCLLKLNGTWQKHNSEMIGFVPVEPGPLNNQYSFLFKKIKGKPYIIGNIKLFSVYFNKSVERSVRFFTGKPRNVVDAFIDDISLYVKSATDTYQIVNALIPA